MFGGFFQKPHLSIKKEHEKSFLRKPNRAYINNKKNAASSNLITYNNKKIASNRDYWHDCNHYRPKVITPIIGYCGLIGIVHRRLICLVSVGVLRRN